MGDSWRLLTGSLPPIGARGRQSFPVTPEFERKDAMSYQDRELESLIQKGQTQGYLTYDEVNAYLPDEDVTPEKLDNLLLALDEKGIRLVDSAPLKIVEEPR